MFVVAGKLKGRKLFVPLHLKVTEARVKEVIANIVGKEFSNCVVLDLFAGSGALGIEALSQGAQKAVFVEKSIISLKALKRNIHALQLEPQAKIWRQDAFSFLKQAKKRQEKFDVVFLDPPYRQRLITKSLKAVRKYDILSPSGFIVCLSSIYEKAGAEGYFCVFARVYGDRKVEILQNK